MPTGATRKENATGKRSQPPPVPQAHEGNAGGTGRIPKKIAASSPFAVTCAAWLSTQTKNPNTKPALAALIAQSGSIPSREISPLNIGQATASWKDKSQHTRANYSGALRRFLSWAGAEGLTSRALLVATPKVRQPDARAIVATAAERKKLLDTAAPNLKFFILLCADLGLRHKTAAGIRLDDYSEAERSLTFRTKGNVTQTLPVTKEIADTIEKLPKDADRTRPIVALLQHSPRGSLTGPHPRFTKQWDRLKEQTGMRRELHIHDLRRTVAEEVWDTTHDIRIVQAQLGHRSPVTTARYLANRVTQEDLKKVRGEMDRRRNK